MQELLIEISSASVAFALDSMTRSFTPDPNGTPGPNWGLRPQSPIIVSYRLAHQSCARYVLAPKYSSPNQTSLCSMRQTNAVVTTTIRLRFDGRSTAY